MRPETKTNISSLAATAGVTAFVVWMAFFATARHDSIFTHVPRSSSSAIALPAARDNAPAVGRG
jgi:hypothetical protein